MKVLEVKVITCDGAADFIEVEIDAPCAVYPYEGNQTLRFYAATGSGEQYVKTHFNVEPKIIKL